MGMFIPKGSIDSTPALVQIMTWSLTGDMPLSELIVAYFTDAYMSHWLSMV